MPVALTIAPDPPAPLIPPRKRWTRAECAALESSGVWDQQTIELIDGELISKMGKNRPHVNALLAMMCECASRNDALADGHIREGQS